MRYNQGSRRSTVYAVLVNYNGLPHVLDGILSLLDLARAPERIVMVDNASRDGSPDIVRERFPMVELLTSPVNAGFAQGANLGLELALQRGADTVWLFNPDARAHPRALEAMLRVLDADPQVGAVGSLLRWAGRDRVQAWGGGRVSLVTGRARHLTRPPDRGGLDYLCGASLLLRARALRQVGLLDPGFPLYWEDADLSLRLRRAGWRLAVAPDSVVEHQPSTGLGHDEAAWHRLYTGGSLRFFGKHAPLPWLPVGLGSAARLARRLAQGRRAAAAGIIQGLFSRDWKKLPS
ncbi:rhamnosyltransferase [Desulfoferula mesophila]|uniref:Rhamnosyltransferase n=1 Tax=Desulfoferula mesophila TaxID=3058419 RepID=A0AAU9EWE8_9BACT|nr:rhamnosyltransferase [Desulfoferula mesophilus]